MKAWERETDLQRQVTELRAELFFTKVLLFLSAAFAAWLVATNKEWWS